MVNLNNLFILIESRGLTQKQLHEATGISTGNISDWKKGRSMPSASALDVLANYFNCSVDYILGRTDNPSLITDAYIGGDNNGVQAVKNGEVAIQHTNTDTFTQQLLEMVDGLSLVQKAEVIMMISKMKPE